MPASTFEQTPAGQEFAEHLAIARRASRKSQIESARYPVPADEWTAQIQVAEAAVAVLWRLVQQTRAADYKREQILWRRHNERLWEIKRQLDAVIM